MGNTSVVAALTLLLHQLSANLVMSAETTPETTEI